jgi:type IV pilus assembly protein PilM
VEVNLSWEEIRRQAARFAGRFGAARLAGLRMFRPHYPPLAVEVGESAWSLVFVDRERREGPVVRRYRQIDIPAGAVDLQFGRPTLVRPAEVGAALLRVLQQESIDASSVSLVLPDHLARVSLLHLGEQPVRRQEAIDLIRWKLRKAVPFKIEDAHVDYQIFPIAAGGGACLCLATTILQPVLDQYERLFRDIGLHLGLIDLSSFNLVNLYVPLLQAEAGDVFVLNVTGSFFALMVLREGIPLFYRAKSYVFADDASRQSRGNLLLRELDGSVAYYRERLGGTAPARVYLRCVDFDAGEVMRGVQERIGVAAETIDPGKVVRIVAREAEAAAQGRLLQRIAPSLGAALGRES